MDIYFRIYDSDDLERIYSEDELGDDDGYDLGTENDEMTDFYTTS